MKKILVCLDGSAYADNICKNAAWVAKQLDASVELLHVLRRSSDYAAPGHDHTGSIGLGARSDLLNSLSKLDEERARLDMEKGRMILQHGEDVLKAEGVTHVTRQHRRGSLVETLKSMEQDAEMIFIGKRGEHADQSSEFLGANLEKTARAVEKPLFVVSADVRPIKRFLIAYDGKQSAQKALDYVATSPLLQGVDAHSVGTDNSIALDTAEQKLRDRGFSVSAKRLDAADPDTAITEYVRSNDIDLLVTGAYSHSRMRSLLLGSTTATLIKSCKVPLLLFR